MKNENWYKRQINGLFLILDDADNKDIMITREYVKEKLTMILNGQGINFHPIINDALDELEKNGRKNND